MKRIALLALTACCGGAPAPVTPSGPPPEKSVQINAPGKAVNVEAALPEGYVTVVDFWAVSCGACAVVGGMLAAEVADQPLVVIRKVDVGDGFSPVAEAYNISALPHFKVYDKHHRMRADLVGNDATKAGWIAKQLAAED